MVDFRQHKDLLKELVKKVNDADKNWDWKVKSIAKNKVMIEWGYLIYVEEKFPKTCFSLTSDYPVDEDLVDSVTLRKPDGRMIDMITFGEHRSAEVRKIESALRFAIEDIAEYAHSRY